MASMAPGSDPAAGSSGPHRAGTVLAWASMVLGLVGLVLVTVAFYQIGVGPAYANPAWGEVAAVVAWLVVLGAVAMSRVTMHLMPKGQPGHDFAVGAFRVTVLWLVLSVLVIFPVLFLDVIGGD